MTDYQTDFSPQESQLYSRQMRLPQIGIKGQQKLRQSRILIVGVGGLGCPSALYLAAAGVGTLTLIDHDIVEVSNLHRQILYSVADCGRAKVEVARERLQALNPHLHLNIWQKKFSAENAEELLSQHDLIIDASDNFPTRYFVNDICRLNKKPYVFGSVDRFQGQFSLFRSRDHDACYRCVFPLNANAHQDAAENIPNCAEAGVLGVVPGLIGNYQANLPALNFLLQLDQDQDQTHFYSLDARYLSLKTMKLKQDPSCPLCSGEITNAENIVRQGNVNMSNHQNDAEITVAELLKKQMNQDDFFLLDVRTPREYELANLQGYLLPVQEIAQRYQELIPYREKEIIVYCHHGVRSAFACRFLQKLGFTNVKNLIGGIDEWSLQIDPAVDRYE